MDRLVEPLKVLELSRFLILYGKGIEDAYLPQSLQEIDIEYALLHHLKDSGWRRVVFVHPEKPFHFLDDESRDLSSSIIWENQTTSPDIISSDLQPGPYGKRILVPNPSPQMIINSLIIGDSHAVRLMDVLMNDTSGPQTAIIFIQAESFLANFQDHRTLSGIISSWSRLPTTNHNRCIFTFSANEYSELKDIAAQCPIPEIRSLMYEGISSPKEGSSIRQIQGPMLDECERIIKFSVRTNLVQYNDSDLHKIAEKIEAENILSKIWLSRFRNLRDISLDSIRENGWFSSFQGDPRPAIDRLNNLIGLAEIKGRIIELSGWIAMRKKQSKRNSLPSLHLVFTGNPGTGKTTIARLVGELFHDLGILKRGHLIETKAADLVADHVGGTTIKTNQVIDSALDGVLFIDEAYSLAAIDRGGFGAEAIETILTRMEDDRSRLVIVLAGYHEQMNHLIQSNPGLSRRIPVENRFYFPDYSPLELLEILIKQIKERQLEISKEISSVLPEIISNMAATKFENFGNAGEMRNFAESLERRCLSRIHQGGGNARSILKLADISPEYQSYLPKELPTAETIMKDLNRLVGLNEVKRFIKRQMARVQFDQIEKQRTKDNPAKTAPQNLVFVGNPGTGKTTVARYVGQIYQSLGLLRKGHLVEVSMPDLIAGYVGQTTAKVMEKVKEALDGVLFIDEAYALVRNSSLFSASYGQEAIDTLVKAIEDHKQRLVVIMAGYPEEMEVLLRSNPGLRSRFSPPIHFEDFEFNQMHELLLNKLSTDDLSMSEEVQEIFLNTLDYKKQESPQTFGNARDLLSYYERAKDHLAERVIQSIENTGRSFSTIPIEYRSFTLDDITGEGYTIVVESNDQKDVNQNKRLKSWVIPNQ